MENTNPCQSANSQSHKNDTQKPNGGKGAFRDGKIKRLCFAEVKQVEGNVMSGRKGGADRCLRQDILEIINTAI